MPLHSKKHITNGIVALWRIEESKDELLDMLPLNWQANLDLAHVKRHNLAARVLANTVCPDFDILEKDEFGKPYFESEDHKISITHAGDYAGFMLTEKKDCGMDMEQITGRIRRITKKFVREDEEGFLRQGLNGMYAIWCAKEAMYKYYGLKSLDFKEHMKLHPSQLNTQGTLSGVIHKKQYIKELDLDYEFFDDYLLIHTT